MRLRRRLATIVAAVLAVVGYPSAVFAFDPLDPVNCRTHPEHPMCTVKVDEPGGTGEGMRSDSAGSGEQGPQRCTTRLLSRQNPPPGAGPGAWYERSCVTGDGLANVTTVWLADGDVTANLGQQAVAMLRLPALRMRLSPQPPAPQLVNLPTWFWVDASSWGRRTATAEAGGSAATATATPTRVTWLTGDGNHVTCTGPGTAWRPGMDPLGEPPCGHTYRRPSADRPGGELLVRATITWRVTWVATGGVTGQEADLSTTSAVSVRVVETQAINVGRSRR
ncbi:hypothetical protein [Phytohabitans houttuyneae]|uniref:hypothetical protein n=1 Tax=Phytohabitans houttuyneae TaxID=1076126 RepID=UPI0031F1422C